MNTDKTQSLLRSATACLEEIRKIYIPSKSSSLKSTDSQLLASQIFRVRQEQHRVYEHLIALYQTIIPHLASNCPDEKSYIEVLKALGPELSAQNLLSSDLSRHTVNAVIVCIPTKETNEGDATTWSESTKLQTNTSQNSSVAFESVASLWKTEILPFLSVYDQLFEIYQKLLSQFRLQAAHIAPNLSSLCGKQVTGLLLGLTGGLSELARMTGSQIRALKTSVPSITNLQAGKLNGVRTPTVLSHVSWVRKQFPDPSEYQSVLRHLANKVVLAARCDAFRTVQPDQQSLESTNGTKNRNVSNISENENTETDFTSESETEKSVLNLSVPQESLPAEKSKQKVSSLGAYGKQLRRELCATELRRYTKEEEEERALPRPEPPKHRVSRGGWRARLRRKREREVAYAEKQTEEVTQSWEAADW